MYHISDNRSPYASQSLRDARDSVVARVCHTRGLWDSYDAATAPLRFSITTVLPSFSPAPKIALPGCKHNG